MCNSISDIQHLITTQAVAAIPWRIMPLISEIPISSPVTKCQFIGIVSNLQPVRILMNISQKLSQFSRILNDHITITSKTDWHYNSFDDLYLTEDNVFSWSCFPSLVWCLNFVWVNFYQGAALAFFYVG